MNKPLSLVRTHDFCASGSPRLAVVMLHGISSSSETFDSALEFLEKEKSLADVRFVTFDLLGCGKSLKSDELEYNFSEHLEALDNSINDLDLEGIPLILVGHSMGCLIAVRYADAHRRKVHELVLISPPIYHPEDFKNPVFIAGQDSFKQIVISKKPNMKGDKAFENDLKNMVLNENNYQFFTKLNKKTTIIFGLADQIIASFNIPRLLRTNKNITAIETPGTHGVTRDKYIKLKEVLEKYCEAL